MNGMLMLKSKNVMPETVLLVDKPKRADSGEEEEEQGQVVFMYAHHLRLIGCTLDQFYRAPYVLREDNCPVNGWLKEYVKNMRDTLEADIRLKISTDMARASEVIQKLRRLSMDCEVSREQFVKLTADAADYSVVTYSGDSIKAAEDLQEARLSGNKRLREVVETDNDEEEEEEEKKTLLSQE
jgi:hypothetical protein